MSFYISLFSLGRIRVCICPVKKMHLLGPTGVSARVSRARGLRQTGREMRALLEVSDAWPPLPRTSLS